MYGYSIIGVLVSLGFRLLGGAKVVPVRTGGTMGAVGVGTGGVRDIAVASYSTRALVLIHLRAL